MGKAGGTEKEGVGEAWGLACLLVLSGKGKSWVKEEEE